MSDLLTIPFNKIRSEGNYKEILEALERGFSKFGIDFSRSLISHILVGIKEITG